MRSKQVSCFDHLGDIIIVIIIILANIISRLFHVKSLKCLMYRVCNKFNPIFTDISMYPIQY